MKKINIDRSWEYLESPLNYIDSVMREKNWTLVDLPHDIAIEKERRKENPSGPDEGFTPGCSLFYKKELDLGEEYKDKNLILEFEGIMGISEIFINGFLVKKHFYGYTSFLVDITKYIKIGEKNTLIVHVENTHKPSSRWYAGTGIYRHVWLHVGDKVYIKPWEFHVTYDILNNEKAIIYPKVILKNTDDKAQNGKLIFEIFAKNNELLKSKEIDFYLDSKEEKEFKTEIELSNFIFWDIENPYIYKMKARVIKDNKEIDSSETELGIRSITISPEEGLKLNGRPIKLKGGCIHHDHGILGSKSYDRAEKRKVEILKNNGFNAVRLAHNPYAPSFLTYCDRLGLLVIEEFFDVWTCGKKSYDYHLYFEKYWEEDIESTIKRDFNHPSIIMWSIGNEVTWGSGIDWEREEGYSSIYEWSDKLAKKVKEIDPIRLVTSAFCGLSFESINVEDREEDNIVLLGIWKGNEETKERWGEITKRFFRHLDVAGYNYKIERYAYDRIKYKDRIICGTETFPYTMYDNWKETLENPNVIGDFVWTAIDYLGEAGIGRVSIDREEANNFLGKYPWFLANCGDIDICGEKRPQSYYRDIVWGNRKDPIIFALPPELYGKKLYMRAWSWEPVERSYNFKGYEGKPIRIYIYANADEVELFLNGKSLGRKISGEKVKFKTTYDITYEPGILEVIAYKDGKEVGRDRLETTSNPFELKIIPDRKELLSYGDLCYLKIIAVDEKGLIVPDADNKIVVEVKGDGKLIALGNSDPFFEGSLVSPFGKLYKGKALAVIKSIKDEGEIYIKVSGDMLKSSEEKIYIKREIP